MYNAKIVGVGCYLPDKIYDNAYMESIVETSDEWIMQRTGIKERHITEPDVFTTDIAARAAENALENAGMTASELDLIIVATVTPDYFTPSCSCVVQKLIGADSAAAFDINAACSGFVTALTVAKQFIACGTYKNVLVVGAECLSKATDYKDRSTCILFGDAAGAAIVQATDEPGIISQWIGARGIDGENLTSLAYREDEAELEKRISKKKNTIWMAGGTVMKFAVKIMAEAAQKVLADANLTWDDIALVVPHQANIRIVEGAVKRMNIDPAKVFVNIERYGNTSAACIPVALCEAVNEGRIKKGDKVILVGFGGGLTWGAALLQW